MEPEFVDQARKSIVENLLFLIHQVAKDEVPAWVSLEAPSGWGKTRIVQEFYRSLAELQEKPRYWPASILGDAAELQIKERRKRTYPKNFIVPRGALPSWAWFGISCSHREGDGPIAALDLDMQQLIAHADDLEEAWRKGVTKSARFKRWVQTQATRAAKDAAQEIAGLFLPYWSLLFRAGQEASGALQTAAERRKMQTKDREVLVGSTDEVAAAFAEQLLRIAIPALPVVVFVEDLHAADPVLLEALRRIMIADSGAVMVITSTWPRLVGNEALQAELFNQVPAERVYRLSSDPKVIEEKAPFTGVDGIADLDEASRISIAKSHLPNASDDTLGLIARRYQNPYAIELYCQLGKVRRQIDQGGELTHRDLAQAPNNVLEIYEAMWRELPESMQMALALSALGSPGAISEASGQGDDRWNAREMAAAIEAFGRLWEGMPNLQFAVGNPQDAFDWARSVDEWLRRFVEVDQRAVALDFAGTAISPKDRDQLLRLLGTSLLNIDAEDLPDEQGLHRARTLLALFEADHIGAVDEVAQAAATILESTVLLRPEERLRITSVGLEAASSQTTRVALKLRSAQATALADTGKVSEAISTFNALLEDQVEQLREASAEVLNTRYELAVQIAEDGDTKRALGLLEALLTDQRDSEDSNQVAILTTRNSIAIRKAALGDPQGALYDLEALLIDKVEILGEDHPSTLKTRNSIAIRKAELDDPQGALDDLEALLIDKVRILGPDHPSTLKTRNGIPIRKYALGETDDALKDFARLIQDKDRVLGPDDPSTLKTRFQQARCIARVGLPEEAITAFEALLTDQVRVLGATHERTLITRGELARLYSDTGMKEKCIKTIEDLIADRNAKYGSDDGVTLQLRSELCMALDRFNVLGEDTAALDLLLSEQRRLLGEDDHRTLSTWYQLLQKRGLRGDMPSNEVLEQLSRVHERQVAQLGADHPEVFQTLKLMEQLRDNPGE